MIDPRLNDHGYTETERMLLASRAGLIPADHPQLWRDSDLLASAERADARRARDVAPQGETVRLFEPAPAQMPGQIPLSDHGRFLAAWHSGRTGHPSARNRF